MPTRVASPRSARVLFASTVLFAGSCYHYHAYQIGGAEGREQGNQPATEWQSRTLHSLLWGTIRQDLAIDNCRLADGTRQGIEEVRVGTNIVYILASALTLGIWVPVDVSWRCAKPPVTSGTLK